MEVELESNSVKAFPFMWYAALESGLHANSYAIFFHEIFGSLIKL